MAKNSATSAECMALQRKLDGPAKWFWPSIFALNAKAGEGHGQA
jgi:hypothetical protein